MIFRGYALGTTTHNILSLANLPDLGPDFNIEMSKEGEPWDITIYVSVHNENYGLEKEGVPALKKLGEVDEPIWKGIHDVLSARVGNS